MLLFLRRLQHIALHPAVQNGDDAVGTAGQLRLVGHHHKSDALFAGHFQHPPKHLFAGAAVQVAGGLVGKNDLGLSHKRAGDAHPLLLAAAHLGGQVVGAAKQTHVFQFPPGGPDAGGLVHALEHQRHGHVFGGGHAGQQVVTLKDKAQMLLPEPGQLGLVHGADLMHADEHLSAAGLFQPGQLVQQGGFSAAGLSHDAAEFPFADADVHIVQRPHPFLAHGVDLAQAHRADDGRQSPRPLF